MKSLLLFILVCLSFAAWSQEPIPRMQKYSVLETGCTYYLPDSVNFELSFSEDGAKVIVCEVLFGNFHFSTITVEFVEGTVESEEDKKAILESYLDYLKGTFEITESANYGWGHTLDSNPNAIGVIDYWVDSEGTQFALKAWCDGAFLSVMLIYGNEEYPYYNVQEMFFDGFRFPTAK